MKITRDAYGRAMLDYHLGQQDGATYIERSDGRLEVDAAAGYFQGYRHWWPHVRAAMRLARGRVLDVGCGSGRHALHLQAKGLEVVATDNSPSIIKLVRLRGVRQARQIAFGQLSSSSRLGAFDTVLMLGNNFGLFGSFSKARRMLRRLHRLTRPGAVILAESMDPYKTRKRAHTDYHAANRRLGRMGGQIRLRARYGNLATPWFDYLVVSREELRTILVGTDWRLSKTLSSGGPLYLAVIERVGIT